MHRLQERSIPKNMGCLMGCFKNRLGTVFKENHLREDSMKAAEVQSENLSREVKNFPVSQTVMY